VSYVLNPYRFAAVDSDYVEATGGTITTEGNYKVHTFLAEGTDFEITNAGTADGSDTFDYLVVAGGGGGGVGDNLNYSGGGGGAGGYNYVTGQAAAEQTYSVTIGAGGAGSSSGTSRGSNGSNTQLGSFTEMDGGGGGGSFNGNYTSNFAYLSGADGGSGGGASLAGTSSVDGRGGSASDAAYGNDGGGDGTYTSNAGQGGGGKGAAGSLATTSNGATGGAGEANSISFTSTTYAGGGGGSGSVSAGAGGSGGGGAGGTGTAHSTTGTENSGGGGGGGAVNDTSYDGAAGGKGLIVCRYRTSHDYIEAEGGTVTTSGDYKLHTFTGDGGFAITNAGTADGSNTFDYVVYGGGAGGGSGSGAGGGGGGYRTATGISSSETTVAVTVGAGGAGDTDQSGAGGDGTASSYAQAGSQEFFDVSSNGHVITTAGNTAYDTTTKKIGNASIDFDGSGDYVTAPESSDFELGSQFTIEWWMNPTDAVDERGGIIEYLTEGADTPYWRVYLSAPSASTTSISWRDTDNLFELETAWDYSWGTWYHVAFVQDATTFKLYIDGVEQASTSAITVPTFPASGNDKLVIGADLVGGHDYYTGYLDQIRISNVARYTTAFTPVEEPFVVDSNTKLLIEPTYTAAGVSIISAGGGGGGGTYDVDDGDGTSSADGSGGGASTYFTDDTYSGAGGTGGSYGNDGGVASLAEGDSGYYLYPNGGGGGAGGAGGDASYSDSTFSGGDGGIGAKPSWLTNLRGGGGGGGCDYDSGSSDVGQGGTGYGGGGDGGYADDSGSNTGGDGTANYGAGGGGGSYSSDASAYYDGGDGGSGIVVFRYKYK